MSGILNVMVAGKAAAVAAGSVWGDHGTNVSLSTTVIANDTATGLDNSFSSVRGTQAHDTSGKFYFEIKLVAAPAVPNFILGVMDSTTANGAAMDDRLLAQSCGNVAFNGNQNSNTWNGGDIAGGFSLTNGDVFGYAADFDNGFFYLAQNNVWFLSGVPTSGSSGTGNIGSGTRSDVRPMLSLWGTTVNSGLIQLVTTNAAFTYTKPSGYSEWG